MKDPDSAKFRYMRFIEAGNNNDTIGGFVCGNVNAKTVMARTLDFRLSM